MTGVNGAASGAGVLLDSAADVVERAADARRLPELAADIDVGGTPADVVYSENKLDLLHYEPRTGSQHDVPVLVVYALINRPYILDLQPDRSVVRRLLEHGLDVYLIDWGEPSTLDASLTLGDYVTRYIDNCVDVVRERSDVPEVNLLGYCMGGTMSAMYAARTPEKVRSLALMAASLHFEDTGGVLELWGSEEYYSPGAVAETLGTVPASLFDAGFALMDPVENTVSKYVRLFDNIEDEDFVRNFARMEHWLNDGIDMAGETYRQFITEIYQENRLSRNELELGGEPVDVGNIDMPVLQIVAEYDHLVPPEASVPFNDVIGSEDVEVFEISTGHIGLSVSRTAHRELWPSVCEWFVERSELDSTDLQLVSGIGSKYEERLNEAGIDSLVALLEADADDLADRTDLSRSRIEEWKERAADLGFDT